MSINSVATNAISQWVGGYLIGNVVDRNFPAISSDGGTLSLGLEIAAQLIIDGIAIYAWSDWATRRGYVSSSDPTKGAILVMSFITSQPTLFLKMRTFNDRLLNTIKLFNLGSFNLSTLQPPPSNTPGSNNNTPQAQTSGMRQQDNPDYGSNSETTVY
jgi:hypothetical protein